MTFRRPVRLAVLLALAAAGCGAHESSTAGGASGGGSKPRVALVLKTLNSPFFIDMEKGARESWDRLAEVIDTMR